MEHHNIDCLSKLLTRPKNKELDINGVNVKQIHDWYDTNFRQQTLGIDGGLHLKDGVMYGGAFEIETFVIDGKECMFKVDRADAEIVKYSDEDGDLVEYNVRVWFISQLASESNRNFACIYLIVQPDTKTGLVQGFTNKFKCSGYRVGERVELLSGQGTGRILMEALVKYCRKYQVELDITRLELGDESMYECRPKVYIELIYSNILCGKLPYYMKFGFKPMLPSSCKKIESNLKLMSNKSVTTDLLDKLRVIIKIKGNIPDNIEKLVIGNLGRKLTVCLNSMLHEDCIFFAQVYKKLFDSFDLDDYGSRIH